GGKVVGAGDGKGCSKNEYEEPREAGSYERLATGKKWQDTWTALLPVLESAAVRPAVKVVSESGEPIWGVSWQSAATPDGLIVNLYNATLDPVTFKLSNG